MVEKVANEGFERVASGVVESDDDDQGQGAQEVGQNKAFKESWFELVEVLGFCFCFSGFFYFVVGGVRHEGEDDEDDEID